MTLWHLSQLRFYTDFCTYLVRVLFIGFPCGSAVKNPLAMQETACNAVDVVQSLGGEDPLEKEMATDFSVLAWEIMDRGAWWATVHVVTRVGHN